MPDVFGKIAGKDKSKIVIGNKAMGGPIDYMYIGKMDVSSRYDKTKNILTVSNGELIPSQYYADTHSLFLD